jgi:glutaredoxin-like protein NrdH
MPVSILEMGIPSGFYLLPKGRRPSGKFPDIDRIARWADHGVLALKPGPVSQYNSRSKGLSDPEEIRKKFRALAKKGECEMVENSVKIYTLSTCGHCKATKKFLGDCGIKFEFTDVDLLNGEERQAILEEVRKFNPSCSFPTIVIGDKIIVGHKEDEIKAALGLT